MEQPPSPQSQSRQIRVFISSTFRDMMRERDLLVKRVFPALRRICAKRFVTFTEVDLRWGITEEQAAEGQVLPLCLAEIERSRPYFIGLLGERYGWIPDEIPADIIADEPWLAEHVHGRKSVTELEILHGVLNDRAMHGHAVFYFRDPDYGLDLEKYPDITGDERRELAERDIPAEIEKHGEDEAARRTQERRDKLAALKQRIRGTGLPLVDPYATPESLADDIEKRFTALIDELYPEGETPDPLTQERLAHEAHAKNKLFACIERPAHLAALTAFSDLGDHGGRGLVVTGESGGGKTALLAAWAHDWSRNNPDDFLVQHYFGATPDSSSPDGFLCRLLFEIKVRFGVDEDPPGDPDKLREALPLWLVYIPRDVQMLLVLDGLNQMRGSEADRQLRFLPQRFPAHITVVASALPGPALAALRERGWVEHDLARASAEEVDTMVGEYFRLLGRHVDSEGRPIQTPLRRQLVASPGCKNPLYLRTVLEELRQFGSFEQLPSHVAGYLEAITPKELFLTVLRRWQADFDGNDPKAQNFNLTRRALTHLWAAREGLSEAEVLDLLGDGADPLPRAFWTPLFLALEPHLSQRTGVFAFGHDFLRQAVEAEFLAESQAQTAAHLAVADYFERHPQQLEMSARKAAEWPFQLHAAEAWERLEACLTNIPLFRALCNARTQWELTGYWHPLRKNGRDMGQCYSTAYARWTDEGNAKDHSVSAQIGAFLLENGLYSPAEPLLREALEARERVLGANHPETLSSVNSLAILLTGQGDYAGAQPLYEWALEARERVLGGEHPDTLESMHNLAYLLDCKGDYTGAQYLYERALKAREQVLGAEHPNTLATLNSLGMLMMSKGAYSTAQPLLEQALAAKERTLGTEHPSTLRSMNNVAGLLEKKGDYAGAQLLYEQALELGKRILGPDHPDTLTRMNNLAGILKEKGDHSGSQSLYQHVTEARKLVLGPEHPLTLTTICNQATSMFETGDYDGAQALYLHVLDARDRVLGPEHPDTLVSQFLVALTLSTKGDCATAMPIFERSLEGLLRVSRAMDHPHPDLGMFLGNYTRCRKKLGHGAEEIQRSVTEMASRYGFGVRQTD